MNTEADITLETSIHQAFNKLAGAMIPTAAVASINSHEMAEDNKTLCIMCEMQDGSTVMISIAPGEQISCRVVA